MRLTITTFVTLDGVMQAPGGRAEDTEDGFAYGGWQAPFTDDDMGPIIVDGFARADAFLLGRRTYDIFYPYWSKKTDEDDPVARPLNKLPKYVASRTLTAAEWAHTTVLSGDVATEVAALKASPGNELQVWGSQRLARTLFDEGLIDEYRLFVYPVVLGRGKRLFDGVTKPTAMRLVDSRTLGSGASFLTYEPSGPAEFGEVDG